ncbi:hypothetical protein ONS95_003594 [Cadophora gregata]|uniref:uncharacterized protein n=1 Tax=Cadophora gregata TaxID=51156 RepID=UPI0026DC9A02|nr:uncharacterized protein ONS95_003594 [Cadophora gregata]KAK0106872.1 hypothetical protein ONS95_003594 [Cadophora gregata]
MAIRNVPDGPWLHKNWRDRGTAGDQEANNEPVEPEDEVIETEHQKADSESAKPEDPVTEPPAEEEETASQPKIFEHPPGLLPRDFRSRLPNILTSPPPPSHSELGQLLRKCDAFFNQFRTQQRAFYIWAEYHNDRADNTSVNIIKWIVDQDQEYVDMEKDRRKVAPDGSVVDVE